MQIDGHLSPICSLPAQFAGACTAITRHAPNLSSFGLRHLAAVRTVVGFFWRSAFVFGSHRLQTKKQQKGRGIVIGCKS
jgi:hypothetical protein